MKHPTINEADVEVYIEVRAIYDGGSVAKMKDGTYRNRWNPDTDPRLHAATDTWIKMKEQHDNAAP